MDPREHRKEDYLKTLGTRPGYAEYLESLPVGKRQRVQTSAASYKHGLHAAAPLTCKGPDRCPFYDACPIPDRAGEHLEDQWYPIGLACVLEAEYMNQRVAEYLGHLDVDPANPVEMSMVQELALIDLYKNRAVMVLSHGDTEGQGRSFMHVDESVTGFTDNGTPLLSKTTKLHPVLEYIDKLERRREKWLDRFMETRKAKADWNIKMGVQTQDSKMIQDIQDIKKFLDGIKAEPVLLDDGIGLDERYDSTT